MITKRPCKDLIVNSVANCVVTEFGIQNSKLIYLVSFCFFATKYD